MTTAAKSVRACRRPDSNRYGPLGPGDFKSPVSTVSPLRPERPACGRLDAGSNRHLTATARPYYGCGVYALVEIKGKQYRVRPGAEVVVDRLAAPPAESLDLDSVLLLSDGARVLIGDPYVAGARVRARVAGEERGRKLRVATYRRRKRTQRTIGHRQRFTRLVIETVDTDASHG